MKAPQNSNVPSADTLPLQVAVLFGGRSVEHEISVISALQLIDALDQEKYKAIPVYITPEGKWISGEPLLDRNLYKKLGYLESVCQQVTLLPQPGGRGLHILTHKKDLLNCRLSGLSTEVIPVDVFLLAFHGEFGEDGCIQGLCELADVAYTGSPVMASALSMNKYICKLAAQADGVPVLPAIKIERVEAQQNLGAICARIFAREGFERFPLFVKPCNLGSSIGISRVNSSEEMPAALAKALRYDSSALVEPCISNLMEINVSVREHPQQGALASVIEIPVSTSGVLSYEEKYLRDGGKKRGPSSGMASLTRLIDPPTLPQETKLRAQNLAIQIFKLFDCSGVARLDFMIDLGTNELYFNELNPFPGSVSFYLWIKSHPRVLFTQLLSDMIQTALTRKGRRDSLDRFIGLRALK